MKVPNYQLGLVPSTLSLSRLQNEGSQPVAFDTDPNVKSIKATE